MVSTQKGKRIFLHIYQYDQEKIELKGLDSKIKEVILFKDKYKIKHKKTNQGLIIEIPKAKQDSIVTVVEVVLK